MSTAHESSHTEHHSHDHDHDHDHGHSHGTDGHSHPAGIRGFFYGLFVPHSHDAADSIDDAFEASKEGVRAVKISLFLLLGTTLVQFIVVLSSGSVALLADSIHNFADALTAVPLWIAFILGRRLATRKFTYGFGRAEDLVGLFIVGALGVMIGFPLADPIVGLLISAAIILLLWGTVRSIGRRLMDGIEPELLDRARSALDATPGVLATPKLQLRWVGHRLHGAATIIVADMSLSDAETIAGATEHRLGHALPNLDDMAVRTATR